MRIILIIHLLFLFSLPSYPQVFYDQGKQISGSDKIVFGNSNALSVNPAYLGVSEDSKFDIRLLQLGFSSHSEVLDRYYVNRFTFSENSIDTVDKQELADLLALDQFDFNFAMKSTWFGFTFVSPTLGGLSLEVNDEVSGDIFLGQSLTELALNGLDAEWLAGTQGDSVDVPPNAQGSHLYYNHLRSIKLAYGRQIFAIDDLKLYGGIQLTRLLGIGHLDLLFTEDRLEGNASFSRFYGINYGNTSTLGEDLEQNLFHNAGSGWSYGVGVHLNLTSFWSVSLSVMDLGSLTYDYETATVDADKIQVVSDIEDGLESFEFSLEADYLYDVFGFSQGGEFKYNLPARARANTFYSPNESLTLSGDLVLSLADAETRNPVPTSLMLGVRYSPELFQTQLLTFSSGLFYHEVFGIRLPLGIAGNFGGKAITSIATNDIISLLSGEENPLSSLTIMTLGLQWGI